MKNNSEFRISSTQIKRNMVKQFNKFYTELDLEFIYPEDVTNLKKLRDSISMLLISYNELEFVDELLDVEEFYV